MYPWAVPENVNSVLAVPKATAPVVWLTVISRHRQVWTYGLPPRWRVKQMNTSSVDDDRWSTRYTWA
jgi:hypothetical protein